MFFSMSMVSVFFVVSFFGNGVCVGSFGYFYWLVDVFCCGLDIGCVSRSCDELGF